MDGAFYRLTTIPTKKSLLDTTKISGVLHPHFSKDGNRVLWAQSFDLMADIGGRGRWGLWQLNISDFVVIGGIPRLQNTISYTPGGLFGDFTWCESHGWAKHDTLIIFSMNGHGQHENHMDNMVSIMFNLFVENPREKLIRNTQNLAFNQQSEDYLVIILYDYQNNRIKEEEWRAMRDSRSARDSRRFSDPRLAG